MELFKAKHAVVKEELMIPIDPKALETLNKDELMTATELKRLELLLSKVLHKFETFVQHIFKYPLVVVSVCKVGKIVLFCVFSRCTYVGNECCNWSMINLYLIQTLKAMMNLDES